MAELAKKKEELADVRNKLESLKQLLSEAKLQLPKRFESA